MQVAQDIVMILWWMALSTWFGGVLFVAVAAPIIFRTVRDNDPLLPTVLSVAVCYAVGWEGTICIVLGLPLLLIFSSLGGILGALAFVRGPVGAAGAMLLPFLRSAMATLPTHPPPEHAPLGQPAGGLVPRGAL